MGYKEVNRAGATHPTLEVKRVTLDDGLHASLILENGRICKLVSPSGEVAVLNWEGNHSPSRQSPASSSKIDPPRESPQARSAGRPEGFDAARNFWASKSAMGPQHHSSGLKDRWGPGGCSELPVHAGRAPASTSESTEGSADGPSAAEGPATSVALPEDAAEGLQMQTEDAKGAGAVGAECLETEADAQEEDAQEEGAQSAEAALQEQPCTQLPSQQQEAMELLPRVPDREAVDFWPDMPAQAGVDGDIGLGADESLVAASKPIETEAPAEEQEEAHGDAEHAEHTYPQGSQHTATWEHAGGEQKEASQHSITGEHAGGEPEEVSQHGSEEDDRLEELMGAVPTINLRELRTEVASLPEILCRAQRTAELCARGSAPGCQALQGLSPHKLSDGSIHSWVAQSRATAILMQRDHQMPRHHHGFCAGAAQPRALHGEAERDRIRHEEGPGGEAGGSAAGSPGSPQAQAPTRLSARRSLAEVRAAIGIVPGPGAPAAGEAPQPAKGRETPPKTISEAGATTETQAMTQTTALLGTSVWGRLFPGRRVRPDSAGSLAAGVTSAGQAAPSPSKAQHRSMTQRLFGGQRKPRGITLAEWPEKPCAQAMEAAQPSTEPESGSAIKDTAAMAMEESTTSEATSAVTQQTGARQGSRKLRRHPSKATATRTGMAGRWRMEEGEGALAGAQQVEDLLDLPLLQRLAQQRAQEIRILETDDTFEFIQIIPLNGRARMVRRTLYPKSGKMVETRRADSRDGKLRSQLNISPEGHCHMRSLQGEPYAAVFHRRIKMSSGGHRLKIEQKFQLLAPGVMPVKYHSIWHRVEDSDANDMAALYSQREPLLEM